jgi:hypothetical protein
MYVRRTVVPDFSAALLDKHTEIICPMAFATPIAINMNDQKRASVFSCSTGSLKTCESGVIPYEKINTTLH